ncbi:MAG: trypsin-like peptidase domain-containing protein [Candidatus Sumerlaeia bacterium]|nr:trypsin-like peptidase domain-containing protein [Candidatus Sumerlaeia bacterium]
MSGINRTVFMGIKAFLIVALFMGQASGQGIPWEDLGSHLKAEEMLSGEKLNLCDCPDDLEMGEPQRGVIQWIENTFYSWDEYDLVGEDGVTELCILMRQPVEKRLTRDEALILLSASNLWKRHLPGPLDDAEVLPPDDPRLDGKPREMFRHDELEDPDQEKVFPDNDDRTRVTNTESFPFNATTYMTMDFPQGRFRGSGALVSPHTVLTCGHNVFDLEEEEWSSEVTVAPGQYQLTNGGSVSRPFGTRNAVNVATFSAYLNSNPNTNQRFDHDIGAAFIENPFGQVTTYYPLEFAYGGQQGSTVNALGYPGDVQGSGSFAQWLSTGQVLNMLNRQIIHNLYVSPGNSGGPLYTFNPTTGSRRIVAIVTWQGTSTTGSTRLVSQNRATIEDWVAWTPEVSQPPLAPNTTSATNVGMTGFTANWNTSDGATGYRLDISTSSTFGSFISGHNNLDVGNTTSRQISGLSSGTTYYYRVRAYNSNGTSGNSGTISVTTASPEPPNNNFPGQTISGASGQMEGTTLGATRQPGEPEHWSGSTAGSVWYTWTAPSSGAVTFETCEVATYDTATAVYTGSSVGELTLIARDADGCDFRSRVTFNVQGGTTYRIAMSGFEDQTGTFRLDWELGETIPEPPNNNFPGQTISGASGQMDGTTLGSTRQPGEPEHWSDSTAGSVWYTWTAPSSGEVTFETCEVASYDTATAVYTGSSVGELTLIARDADECNFRSRVTFTAQAGSTYRIAMSGYEDKTGTFRLDWFMPNLPTPTPSQPNSNMFILTGSSGQQ